MDRRRAIGILGTVAALPAAAAVRDQFIGTWKLISLERAASDGAVTRAYGDAPVGRLTYDRAGRVAAQLMRPGRRHASLVPAGTSGDSLRNASNEDLREMVTGYSSYYGTFDVDDARKMVIHHVQAALLPHWVGIDLRRAYEFSGDFLILKVLAASSTTTLRWEREKDL